MNKELLIINEEGVMGGGDGGIIPGGGGGDWGGGWVCPSRQIWVTGPVRNGHVLRRGPGSSRRRRPVRRRARRGVMARRGTRMC